MARAAPAAAWGRVRRVVMGGVRDAYEPAVLVGGPLALAGAAVTALVRRNAVRASGSGCGDV
ncbi:hypothetical protein [Nonomuraea salmonea]|uniref:PEP-CTERM sorting domain-containing protein n=1 Tax=Nonomuraea salmonea TaxID=46181 RepID=A0ABV5NZU5_9ACTN